MKNKYFSELEVANICGVVNQTVINWIKANHLKAYSTPGGQFRVSPEDLQNFMTNRGLEVPEYLEEILKQNQNLNIENSKTLIFVDDDKVLNNLINSYIEKNFTTVKVLQAFDGFEAGTLMASEKPSLVVLDLHLPGVDGFSLCKKLKTDSSYNNPLIVAVTALTDEGVQEKITNLGSNYFLTKPLHLEQVGAIVAQWLTSKVV